MATRPTGAAGALLTAVLALLFTGFAAYGAWRLSNSVLLVTRGERVTGRVVSLERVEKRRRAGSRGSTHTVHPVVEFTAADGSVHTFRSRHGSNPPAFELNEFVTVLYPENRPSAAAIEWWVALWLEPATFLLLGGGPLVGVLLARRRTTS